MVNLEKKLTVDDLIVEYMMCKVKNGYNNYFTINEFMTFLDVIKSKMNVYGFNEDGLKMFNDFFERKITRDWSVNNISDSRMTMNYSDELKDYVINCNYKLSLYDESVINTYFMNEREVNNIRKIILEYLSNQEKRKINFNEVNEKDIKLGKYVAVQIIENIWDSYVDKNIKCQKWPIQCRDINKFLFENDLAEIIGIESIKNKLLKLYNVLSTRIACMYHNDNELEISSSTNKFLSRANYELLIKGYEDLFDETYGEYKKSLYIDFTQSKLFQSYQYETVCNKIINNKSLKLVKTIDSNYNSILSYMSPNSK